MINRKRTSLSPPLKLRMSGADVTMKSCRRVPANLTQRTIVFGRCFDCSTWPTTHVTCTLHDFLAEDIPTSSLTDPPFYSNSPFEIFIAVIREDDTDLDSESQRCRPKFTSSVKDYSNLSATLKPSLPHVPKLDTFLSCSSACFSSLLPHINR